MLTDNALETGQFVAMLEIPVMPVELWLAMVPLWIAFIKARGRLFLPYFLSGARCPLLPQSPPHTLLPPGQMSLRLPSPSP